MRIQAQRRDDRVAQQREIVKALGGRIALEISLRHTGVHIDVTAVQRLVVQDVKIKLNQLDL